MSEQADEELRRTRSGSVRSPGPAMPVQVESATIPARRCAQPHRSPQPSIVGIVMEASSCGHGCLLTPFLAPCPLQRKGVEAESSKLPIVLGLPGDQPWSRFHQKYLLVVFYRKQGRNWALWPVWVQAKAEEWADVQEWGSRKRLEMRWGTGQNLRKGF